MFGIFNRQDKIAAVTTTASRIFHVLLIPDDVGHEKESIPFTSYSDLHAAVRDAGGWGFEHVDERKDDGGNVVRRYRLRDSTAHKDLAAFREKWKGTLAKPPWQAEK